MCTLLFAASRLHGSTMLPVEADILHPTICPHLQSAVTLVTMMRRLKMYKDDLQRLNLSFNISYMRYIRGEGLKLQENWEGVQNCWSSSAGC